MWLIKLSKISNRKRANAAVRSTHSLLHIRTSAEFVTFSFSASAFMSKRVLVFACTAGIVQAVGYAVFLQL